MKAEQSVTDAQIRRLFETDSSQGPLISMILPMERGGPEVRKNSVMLKNAVRTARTLLSEAGQSEAVIDKRMTRVEALIDDNDFWQHQSDCLALYIGEGEGFTAFLLSHQHEERVVVNDRFLLTPLLHAAQYQRPAYLLTLSQNQLALYALERGRLEEVEVEGLPENMEEALMLDPEQSLQQHPVTGRAEGGPVMGTHGHGGGKDTRLGHLEDFLHKVEVPVTRFMNQHSVPLYLATVPENEALYRKINKYAGLVESTLHGNFDRQAPHELLEQLADQISEEIAGEARERCREIVNAAGEGNGTTDLDKAIEAAWDGRVHACCVAEGASGLTGKWDPERRKVSYDSESDPRQTDLLDLVASHVWDKGGEVSFVDPEALPEGTHLAVSLRY